MKKILLFVIILLISLFAYGYWQLVKTKPIYSGELTLDGLQEQVEVKFDKFGIPHIYAKNQSDAYFSLGYLQAQERLFQMEMIRRVTTGTLSEILGSEFIDTDKLFRTLGFAKKSEEFARKFESQNYSYKEAALSYFRGINAFVDEGPTPIEFTIIGIPKKRFTVIDAYNAAGYMAFGFADGFRVDPLVSKIAASLGMDYLNDLGVHTIYDSTFIPSYFEPVTEDLTDLSIIVESIPTPLIDGSNSWVLGPTKTASGNAIFENDTHIGFSQPSVWYEAHIEYPNNSIYGHYLAGFPFAILGHNKFAAWGMTMFENDDVDLFQEKANPDNNNQIWRVDQWQDLRVRKETIEVKDEDPVEITIRESIHGPIINDILLEEGTSTEPVSVSWEYLHAEKDLFGPVFMLGEATSMVDARQAASQIQAPGLNIMYADIAGNIAWWASARLPIRPPHVNSKLFLDGSSGKDDYLGYYDFNHNPQSENPPSGYVYSANNQPDTVKGVLFPGYYRPIDRAGSIIDLIESKDNWTAQEVQAMTAYTNSRVAVLIAKELAKVLVAREDDELEILADALENWEGDHKLTSIGPTVYYNMLSWTLYHSMADELGYKNYYNLVNSEIMKRSYLKFISNGESIWWDDISTPERETRSDIIGRAAYNALSSIKSSTNSNQKEEWKWSKIHSVTHGHPLGKVKLLKEYFDVGPLEATGGNEVINNMTFKLDTTGLFPVIMGPSMRTVIDLGNINGAVSINPTGQSGNFLSEHYDDQAQMFVDVKFRPQLMEDAQIEDSKASLLVLKPKK